MEESYKEYVGVIKPFRITSSDGMSARVGRPGWGGGVSKIEFPGLQLHGIWEHFALGCLGAGSAV